MSNRKVVVGRSTLRFELRGLFREPFEVPLSEAMVDAAPFDLPVDTTDAVFARDVRIANVRLQGIASRPDVLIVFAHPVPVRPGLSYAAKMGLSWIEGVRGREVLDGLALQFEAAEALDVLRAAGVEEVRAIDALRTSVGVLEGEEADVVRDRRRRAQRARRLVVGLPYVALLLVLLANLALTGRPAFVVSVSALVVVLVALVGLALVGWRTAGPGAESGSSAGPIDP